MLSTIICGAVCALSIANNTFNNVMVCFNDSDNSIRPYYIVIPHGVILIDPITHNISLWSPLQFLSQWIGIGLLHTVVV